MGVRKKPQADDDTDENQEDTFIALLQRSMESALGKEMEPKDMNALFANCIKFIAVKNKLKGDDGSYWDND